MKCLRGRTYFMEEPKLKEDFLNSMILFLLKDDKQKSFNKDKKRKKRKENSYVCKNTTKSLEYVA